MIGKLLCGLITVVVVHALLNKVKQKDTEITLPEQIRKKEYFMMFLLGAMSFKELTFIAYYYLDYLYTWRLWLIQIITLEKFILPLVI